MSEGRDADRYMYKEKVEIKQFIKILGLGNTKRKIGFLLGMLGFVSSYKQGGLADHNSRSSLLMVS